MDLDPPRSRLRVWPVLVGLSLAFAPGSGCTEPGEVRVEVLRSHRSGAAGDLLGARLTAVGDLNGDGHEDLAVGASQFGTRRGDDGYVLVLSGLTGEVLLQLSGRQGGDGFGDAVAGAGDADGDGTPDILVGSPGSDLGGPDAGAVQLSSGRTGETLWSASGDRGGDLLGVACLALGDIDGDGHPDLVASARQPALGPTRDAGPGYVRAYSGLTGAVLFTVHGPDGLDDFGARLALLGDIDGDGLPDLAVSAPPSQTVLYLSGRDGSVLHEISSRSGGFGASLSTLDDVDGDGLPELLVGAPLDSAHLPLAGAVHLLSGSRGETLAVYRGSLAHRKLGSHLAALGDLDGDGRADFAAGHTVAGTVELLSAADGRRLTLVTGAVDQFGFGLGLASAGDATGDGRSELAVGFPGVGPAGDSPGGLTILRFHSP